MFTYLETLRSKPEAYRMRMVFVGAATVTGIIFFVWLLATIFTYTSTEGRDLNSENPSTFSEISTNLSIILDSGKAQLGN